VTGNESQFIPENAALEGLSRVISQEFPQMMCRFVDMDDTTGTQAIVQEFAAFYGPTGQPVAAFRNGIRYEPVFSVMTAPSGPKNLIKENGVYLITGGMGGIGLTLAASIADKQNVTLVLLGRKQLPVEDQWTHITQNKATKTASVIQKIQAIRAMGSEVLTLSADVSDEDAMEKAIRSIREIKGRINGIVHCAGNPGDGFLFQKGLSTFSEVLLPKIHGTVILDHLTRQDHPDFFILCSSLTALTGAPGQSDYTAANAFQDAYAFARNHDGFKTLVINWPAWKETGMAFDHQVAGHQAGLNCEEGTA
jgi:polyketide synthase PksN